MQGMHLIHTIRFDGTLAANKVWYWKAPFACSLVQASAVASNNSDATLKIGTSADDDAYLAAAAIGDSGAPAEFDRDNFIGGTDLPQVAAGTIVVWTLDYDGSAGTAAQNVDVVTAFSEG